MLITEVQNFVDDYYCTVKDACMHKCVIIKFGDVHICTVYTIPVMCPVCLCV